MGIEKKTDSVSKIESLKSVYQICVDTRKFEISQLIQRNNFFMLFQGVLLAAALQTQNSKPMVEFIICVAGVWVSWYQMQMASGAKYWQEWWESRTVFYEIKLRELLRQEGIEHFYELFSTPQEEVLETVEKAMKGTYPVTNCLILARFAVGRAPIKVGLVLLVVWIALLLTTINWYDFRLGAIASGFYVRMPIN